MLSSVFAFWFQAYYNVIHSRGAVYMFCSGFSSHTVYRAGLSTGAVLQWVLVGDFVEACVCVRLHPLISFAHHLPLWVTIKCFAML